MSDYPKFQIKKHVFGYMVDKASGALGSGSDAAILQYFKLVLDAETGLRLTATDITLTVIAQTSLVDVEVYGELVILAAKLQKLIRLLDPDDVITVEQISSSRVRVYTDSVSWELIAANPSEYPDVPDPAVVSWAAVDREMFRNALRKVYPAAPVAGMRNVNMMIVDVKRSIMQATDGVRFTAAEIDFPFDIQLPIGAVPELLRFLQKAASDEIYVSLTDDAILFKVDNDVLMMSRIEVEFVNVNVILQSVANNDKFLVVDRVSFARALQRVSLSADPDTNQVTLVASSDGSYLMTKSKTGESARHDILTDWQYADQTVIVNLQFLLDAVLAHDAATLTLALPHEESGAIAVVGDRGLVTIMRQFRRIANA